MSLKSIKTVEVTKCCLGKEVSDRWNHCAKINYVYDNVVHGALTTFSVGTFIQTWHKTQNPWLIHMAHIHSNDNSRGIWELVARHIVGINAGLGWWHIAHQVYGISLLMRPLCLAAARINIFNNYRILIGMLITLAWGGNMYRAAAHNWKWATQMRHTDLGQLGKSAPRRKKAGRDRTNVMVNHKTLSGASRRSLV